MVKVFCKQNHTQFYLVLAYTSTFLCEPKFMNEYRVQTNTRNKCILLLRQHAHEASKNNRWNDVILFIVGFGNLHFMFYAVTKNAVKFRGIFQKGVAHEWNILKLIFLDRTRNPNMNLGLGLVYTGTIPYFILVKTRSFYTFVSDQ